MTVGAGLAPNGDTSAVRSIAVRHDDYGILGDAHPQAPPDRL
jgi:hypothetical protein